MGQRKILFSADLEDVRIRNNGILNTTFIKQKLKEIQRNINGDKLVIRYLNIVVLVWNRSNGQKIIDGKPDLNSIINKIDFKWYVEHYT